ncbi:MAG TPA: hypothetical protein VFO93_13140 [Hymenobacter sp.]|uniref:hypothetical protein n=1 Tax=Hymenobacter sp. TaxID=1898978 RepID=UPI002D80BADD|nr:hypothetical protein [Hymenobacter sp.]HET9504479.1 hypothetical protein [Hymenobacter sp.]
MSASSSVGQRFSQLIQALGMSKNAFAVSLDKTATVIQHLVDERNKPGFDLMNKVVDVYPNVSIEWLLRGKGPMMLASFPGAGAPAAAETPAPATPVAPPVPKAAPVAPSFPAPLFAVSAAGPPAPEVPPVAAQYAPPVVPETIVHPAPVVPAPSASQALASQPALPVASAPALSAPAAVALDAATLTAALHAQHLQHQLALAEQRNQHLLEQQKLILERQALMQQMLDLMRRPV